MWFDLAGMTWKAVAVLGLLVLLVPIFASQLWYESEGVVRRFVFVVLGFVWLTLASLLLLVQAAGVELRDTDLRLHLPGYSTSVSYADLQIDKMEFLQQKPGETDARFRPAVRSDGLRVTGFAMGWFLLANGRLALVAVTEGPLVFLPTARGFALVVSVENHQEFVAALRVKGAARD